MTTVDQAQGQLSQGQWVGGERGRSGRLFGSSSQEPSQHQNVGTGERAVSVAAGAILTLLGVQRRSIPGLLLMGVGGALVHRGTTGTCRLYSALDIDTAHPDAAQSGRRQQDLERRGIHVSQAFLINRPAEELYNFWRNFENLPSIMTHLQSVKVLDGGRSHWVTKAPAVAGASVAWDAEITADEPNSRIAWRSLPGSTVDNAGEVRFTPGLGDRGTEVHVHMTYLPPAGRLGHTLAKMLGKSADWQIREDLRNFKRVMECGEIPTIEGQPRGTCLGRGTRS